MNPRFVTAIVLLALMPLPASAVIVAGASGGGNTSNNTTRAQFESEYGVSLPIYDNVIQYSGASGVYLGYNPANSDVWVLTARHIFTDDSAGSTVMIDGLSYNRQADGINYGFLVGGDLRLVRYKRVDLAVPSLPAIHLSMTVPVASTPLLLVGFGKNRIQNATTDAFTSDATSTTVGTGYHWAGSNIKRWGTNVIEADFLDSLETTGPLTGTTGTFSVGSISTVGFMTDFDQPGTGQWLTSNEAQGSSGDSGGAAFRYADGQWHLTGIFTAIAGYSGQASGTSAFGNLSLLTDVATYSSDIQLALDGVILVPEPSTLSMVAMLTSMGILRRSRRRH